ncbi:MAG: glycosyltransferase [Deltaproteobacteria bacterium]|nr:glycosyltransferase [Deltaproteobacteria bacterium]
MVIQSIQTALMLFLSVLYAVLILLLLIPRKRSGVRLRPDATTYAPPLSILIPAYNEGKNIGPTLQSLLKAAYPNEKEIIVIDDGSRDRTVAIVEEFQRRGPNIRLIQTNRLGKARVLNAALKQATHEALIVLDADTTVAPEALLAIVQPLSSPEVAAVAANVRAIPTRKFLTWFQELEYTLSSAWRAAQHTLKTVSVVPQFFAAKKSALEKIGGIPAETATEDFDVCLELTRAGYRIAMEEEAVGFTAVPETISGLFRQRTRWARGTLQVIAKHRGLFLKKDFLPLWLFVLPVVLYWYLHALLYLPTTFYKIGHDYWFYFLHKGQFFSFEVIKYFLGWFTLFGVGRMIFQIITGWLTPTFFYGVVLLVCTLSYSLTFLSVFRFSGGISKRQALAIFCFFPYCLLTLSAIFYGLFRECASLGRAKIIESRVRWEKSL